ncbi:MAG: OmpA family protein [Bacteroidetes bacterium]|nr:OmpA family protein [Bacteroidota bacterium]
MRTIFKVIFIFLLSIGIGLSQQEGRRYNAFSGSMVLTVEGGATLGQTDYSGNKVDYLGRTSLEYFFPAYSKSTFGLRAFGGGGYISGQDATLVPDVFRTKMTFLGGGVVYSLSLSNHVFPYIFAGASYLWFDPFGPNGIKMPNNLKNVYKKNEVDYNSELGFRFLVTNNLSLNVSGGIQLSPNDYLDDVAIGTNNDYFYYAAVGISFSFFSDFDSDGDGVPDSKDQCPNTPSGVKVDATGCPLDSDHDGVPDYLDKCPNTPKGVAVDKDGCPLDSDGDGVPDYRDVCPNTPKGVKVDDLGCPLDSDGDGVPDYKDKCPDSPPGVQVDANGCPLDSDHDGVPDYLDKCPDTAPGVKVDSTGCPVETEKETIKEKIQEPVEETAVKKVTLSAGASFAFGKSELLPSASRELDKIVKVMKDQPNSRWRITGYTDNIGSNQINKFVSLQRAEAVLNYFISKGLSRKRFQVIGLGKANPIASNSTEEGRAKNRRVEIIRIK